MAQNRLGGGSCVRWVNIFSMLVLSPQKEVYMIAAGVIGGVFLVCTVVMFLGVKERDGERIFSCVLGAHLHKTFNHIVKRILAILTTLVE